MHFMKPFALVFVLLSSLCVIIRMDHHNFGYSMKNIPIPSEQEFKLELLNSIHTFDTRMRWRAHFFLNPNPNKSRQEKFGLNTSNPPPSVKELKPLQDGLCELARNIKFREVKNKFQNKLKNDLKEIKNEKKVTVAADKTRNFYKMEPDRYKELLNNNITKDYKKADDKLAHAIAKKDKRIASKLEIADRLYCTSKRESFITIKDHKQNFMNNPKCRVLNPTKSELGKVSKQMLEKIISAVKTKSQLQQWKNTDSVINWFNDLKDKQKLTFIQFDVMNFYAPITPKLLNDAIEHAENYIYISDVTKETILQATNSFLCSDGQTWIKRQGDTFDITMGGFHGAEVCDLVGLFILSQLVTIIPNVGLYRDDGLAVSSATSRQIENMKKKICKVFERNGLNITIEANSKVVNFLDINMDLNTSIYKPFMKENDTPTYVSMKSNHPPAILKNIPLGVNRRLSRISANNTVFNAAAAPYQEALASSGYSHTLEFQPPQELTTKKKNRKRNITWFNPPYSVNVQTNVGKEFLRLIDTVFPPSNPLRKLVTHHHHTIRIFRMYVTLSQKLEIFQMYVQP